MNNQKASRIVPPMRRTLFALALLLAGAVPASAQFSQTGEIGFLVGGSRRFVDGAAKEPGVEFIESNFSFSQSTFELYWKSPLDENTAVKVKTGRIETPVSFAYQLEGNPNTFRADVDGEVQHVEAGIEYRFSEIFGSSALFAGLGMYRQSGPDFDSTTDFGASFGVTADFPMTRRYGIVVDGTYHWVRADFQPRFLTVGAGIRVSF